VIASGLVALAPCEAAAAESKIHAAYVKVGLTLDGSTFRHPGFLMAIDEAGVFEIAAGGRTHAITVSFREVGETYLTIHVEYEINGNTQWVQDIEVEGGVDKVVQKGQAKLTFNVDPQGSEDTSRDDEDKVEGPKHDKDDPLGGA
jgi:hypothetical protein